MSNATSSEVAVLEEHEPFWKAQGYTVVRRPAGEALPAFLKNYSPDALLLGPKPQVVVEVVRKGKPHIETRMRQLRAIIESQSDWRLEVLYTGEEAESLPTASTHELKIALADVRRLLPGEKRGALLLLWATLEALSRRLEPGKTARPQSPGRVVELLASTGHIAPSEAPFLREAVVWRNRLVHGDLETRPSETAVSRLADIIEKLVIDLEIREAAPSV